MEYIPWFAWIVIVAILAGAIIAVANAASGRKAELVQALKQNTEVNEHLRARLEDVERRLASVEKTLTEIPE